MSTEQLRKVKIGEYALHWPREGAFYVFPSEVHEVPAWIADGWVAAGYAELVQDTTEVP